MKYNPVVTTYSKALFAVIKGIGTFDKALQHLHLISELKENNKDFKLVLQSPLVKLEAKYKIIEYIADKLSLYQVVQNFLCLLVKNKRFSLLNQIIDSFSDLIDQEKGIIKAKIITAKELTESEFQDFVILIRKKYNKNFIFDKVVDNTLLGGVIMIFDNKIIDASVAGALKDIKNKSTEIVSML